MRGKVPSLNEKRFAADCIAGGQRLDGRKPTEARSVSVILDPSSWGFAEVMFDKSQAIATTTVEAVCPAADRPNEGILSISIDLSPASSETSAREALHRSSGHQPFFETRTAIESFVRESRAIDTEALCILAGVKVWAIRIAVDITNDDGNCTDVAMMAVMASILHARRPDVTVTGREVRIHPMDEREPLPLPVHHVPLATTFAIFGAGKPYESDAAVVDPTKLEEHASNGTASFAFNAQGEVCGVYKAGGLPLMATTFATCATLSAERAIALTEVLKQAMADAAAEHPLAGTRPMLVSAEPTAIITPLMDGKNEDDKPDTTMSIWNAMPLPDDAPPILSVTPEKEKEEAIGMDESDVFEKRPMKEEAVRTWSQKPTSKICETINVDEDKESEGDSSEEGSSDSDLESAVTLKSSAKSRRKGR